MKSSFFYLLAFVVRFFYLGYYKTVRLRVVNPEFSPRQIAPGLNVVYVTWHSKTFLLLPFCRGLRMGILTLLDWKNFFYDKLSRLFQYQTVPVTSVPRATIQLKRLLEKGCHVAIAVDGPKGPLGQIRPGALYLAQKTKRPIVVTTVVAEKSYRIQKRWDRYEIPLPFTKATVTFSPPIYVDLLNPRQTESKIREFLGAF